jgi:murein DD-endopeptidase MepM/ murein hydrolase activator NlpD
MKQVGDSSTPIWMRPALGSQLDDLPTASDVGQIATPPPELPLAPLVRSIREAMMSPEVMAQAQLLGRQTLAGATAVVLGATTLFVPSHGAAADAAVRGANLGRAPVARVASPAEQAQLLTPSHFPVGGGRYNVGYDGRWQVWDQSQRPLHNSDFSRQATDPNHPRGHMGIDVFGPEGAPIVAPMEAKVVAVGRSRVGGNYVSIRAGNAQMYFAHLDSHAEGLKVGDTVRAGQALGTLGDTGSARGTAPHLHFELKISGQRVDPFDFLMSGHRAERSRAR